MNPRDRQLNKLSRESSLIRDLIAQQREIDKAAGILETAQDVYEKLWKAYLDDTLGCGLDYGLSERIIVQEGDAIYEITFDVDDYTSPVVKRVDRYTRVIVIG